MQEGKIELYLQRKKVLGFPTFWRNLAKAQTITYMTTLFAVNGLEYQSRCKMHIMMTIRGYFFNKDLKKGKIQRSSVETIW